MTDTDICYEPIGVICTDYTSTEEIPRQAASADNTLGRIELYDEYADGLKDISGFSHIILLYHLHQANEAVALTARPPEDGVEHGLFAIRTPRRPNPIGFSVVRLDEVAGATLSIAGVDMLDGTPLLDIKPFIPAIDAREECRVGWLEDA